MKRKYKLTKWRHHSPFIALSTLLLPARYWIWKTTNTLFLNLKKVTCSKDTIYEIRSNEFKPISKTTILHSPNAVIKNSTGNISKTNTLTSPLLLQKLLILKLKLRNMPDHLPPLTNTNSFYNFFITSSKTTLYHRHPFTSP